MALVTSWKGQYLLTPNASPFSACSRHTCGASAPPPLRPGAACWSRSDATESSDSIEGLQMAEGPVGKSESVSRSVVSSSL